MKKLLVIVMMMMAAARIFAIDLGGKLSDGVNYEFEESMSLSSSLDRACERWIKIIGNERMMAFKRLPQNAKAEVVEATKHTEAIMTNIAGKYDIDGYLAVWFRDEAEPDAAYLAFYSNNNGEIQRKLLKYYW